MNKVLQLDIFPGAKLVQETIAKPRDAESDDAKLDFAAVLMGLMMGQQLNQSNVLVEQTEFSHLADQLSLDNQLLTEALVQEGAGNSLEHSQVFQTPLMLDLAQNIKVDGDSPLAKEPAKEVIQPFAQVLGQDLVENLDSAKTEIATELPSGLVAHDYQPFNLNHLVEKSPSITKELLGDGTKDVVLEQPIEQFDPVEQEKQPLDQAKQGLELEQSLDWQTDNFSAQFNTAKSTEVAHKETMLPKQLKSVMQQLVDQSKLSLAEGKSEVEVKLKPEYLGKVHMKVVLEKGMLTAKLAVENLMVGKALESNLHQLKNHMQEQGLNFNQVNVEVGSGTLEQNPKEPFYQQEQFSGSSSQTSPEESFEEIRTTTAELSGVNYLA